MIFWVLLFLHGAHFTGSQPNGSIGSPENITVQVLDAKTVQVFWSSVWNNVERFDVTYNPTEDKIVSQAAGNSQSIVLRELRPDTQYQVTITAVIGGKSYKSRRIVFRTAPDRSAKSDIYPTDALHDGKGPTTASTEYVTVDPTAKYMPLTSSTVRGVELGLVLLALVVWIIAIALFFHRWGKIRMLLPYQPDYKTQQALKVPGTGTTIGASCTGNTGTQGPQEGPGCLQHARWSNCKDERLTAKKRAPSPTRVPPQSSSYFIPDEYERCDSLEVVTHPHHRRNISEESIALCQLNQSPDKKTVTIKVPRNARSADTSDRKRTQNEGYVKLRNPEMNFKQHKQKKHSNSLDNISDSIQSLLGCTSAYNFCQSRRNLGDGRNRYEKEAMKSELEPLFFVGDKELYYNNDYITDTNIVVHHQPKYKEENLPKDTLPEELRPKRYTRSSFKKQKVSLYNEKELDLYMKVPITENKAPPPKMENKATETDKPKSSSSSSRDTAEMKRKTFLRKISLQDTYLNYNQDYWLDFRKSVRFHKSIDLGYFGDDENRKVEVIVERTKPKLSERITEKSNEVIDEVEIGRQQSVPYEIGRRTRNSELTGSLGRTAPTLADFRKAGPAKNFFLLPSSENIPLFCERNGNIETDFDVFGDSPDEEYLVIDKAEPVVGNGIDGRLGDSGGSGELSYDSHLDSYDLIHKYDFSQFYEIKLNTEADPVRRSTVFNFQGGHAFFGENLNSTSDDSDVFYNETENSEAPDRTYPGRTMFSEKPRNSGIV